MVAHWQSIWSQPNRSLRNPQREIGLDDLLHAGGWTSGAGGSVTPDAWREYAFRVGQQLGVASGSSVFEIGVGAGALLYAMTEVWDLEISGIDYSRPLLSLASEALPKGRFELADVAVSPLPNAVTVGISSADIVLVNSVLAYLPSLGAVERLLEALLSGNARCGVLDVPDLRFKEEAESDRARNLPPGEYASKWISQGLTHLYIDPGWLQELAAANGFTCKVEVQHIAGFRQSRHHFNAFLFPMPS